MGIRPLGILMGVKIWSSCLFHPWDLVPPELVHQEAIPIHLPSGADRQACPGALQVEMGAWVGCGAIGVGRGEGQGLRDSSELLPMPTGSWAASHSLRSLAGFSTAPRTRP